MGLLDEAIREHLELKRQHGADEQELARQEAEALGPVTEEDLNGGDAPVAPGPPAAPAERKPGWPFDRVAEDELADEPPEPSFEWSGESAADIEVPSFVPAEPVGGRRGEEGGAEEADAPEPPSEAVEDPSDDVVEEPLGRSAEEGPGLEPEGEHELASEPEAAPTPVEPERDLAVDDPEVASDELEPEPEAGLDLAGEPLPDPPAGAVDPTEPVAPALEPSPTELSEAEPADDDLPQTEAFEAVDLEAVGADEPPPSGDAGASQAAQEERTALAESLPEDAEHGVETPPGYEHAEATEGEAPQAIDPEDPPSSEAEVSAVLDPGPPLAVAPEVLEEEPVSPLEEEDASGPDLPPTELYAPLPEPEPEPEPQPEPRAGPEDEPEAIEPGLATDGPLTPHPAAEQGGPPPPPPEDELGPVTQVWSVVDEPGLAPAPPPDDADLEPFPAEPESELAPAPGGEEGEPAPGAVHDLDPGAPLEATLGDEDLLLERDLGDDVPLGPMPTAEEPDLDRLPDDDSTDLGPAPLADARLDEPPATDFDLDLPRLADDPALRDPSDAEAGRASPLDAPMAAGPADREPDFADQLEEGPPAEPPIAARGFFEETEEHETLWHEEPGGADPDFEN